LERHRFTWSFLERRTNLFSGGSMRMLHVGPEPAFESRIRALSHIDYVTGDRQDDGADHALDLTDLEFSDDSFDVILCSHVLEHIQDDLRAMREMARVLRPSGWAVILVPIIAEKTFDDPSVVDPAERAQLFGQWDHVRAYGNDFADRLSSQGLQVETVSASDLVLDERERQLMQFKSEQLFCCRKEASALAQ
jgi:SAM-dependent methyltransferase